MAQKLSKVRDVVITLPEEFVQDYDSWYPGEGFSTRSAGIREAMKEQMRKRRSPHIEISDAYTARHREEHHKRRYSPSLLERGRPPSVPNN